MENVFLELANRSINASWLVLAIVLLRYLLKKSPKTFIIVLWALVGIRLVCPFSPESVLSLIPNPEPIPTDIYNFEQTTPMEGVVVPNKGGSAVSEATSSVEVNAGRINTVQLMTAGWVIGMLILLTYAAVSSFRLRRKLDVSMPKSENVRLCDDIDTPFILGVIHPRIYLPSSLSAEDAGYAIAHERVHLARHDNLWKLLGFLLLTVFWFNPIMWIAHALFSRDLELACDEEVIRRLGTGSKKSYLNALINCSASRRAVSFHYLAFGEIAVNERVKMILQYKKPKLWLRCVTICICIVFAFCFLTNPISAESTEAPGEQLGTVEVPAATSSSEKIDEIVEASEAETSESDLDAVHAEIEKIIMSETTHESLRHFRMWWGENSSDGVDNIVYQNEGTEDGTVTLLVAYGGGSYPHFENYGAELLTIRIPAGETVVCPLDPGYSYKSFGYIIVGSSYGTVSHNIFINQDAFRINNTPLTEYLKNSTHPTLAERTFG